MTQLSVQSFVERVRQRRLGPDVQVSYRVSGGMPSQRLAYDVSIDSVSGAQGTVYEARSGRATQRLSIPPEKLDVASLFEQIGAGLHSLLPAAKAQFPPDALVGSLTIRVGGEEETFSFVPQEEQRTGPGEATNPSMTRALRQLWDISTGALRSHGEAKSE
jgi:hypothetical protein